MNYTFDPQHNAAYVSIRDVPGGAVIELDDVTFASVDETGLLVGVELLDTTRFGVPFDDHAARRAVEWARTQLELDPAS